MKQIIQRLTRSRSEQRQGDEALSQRPRSKSSGGHNGLFQLGDVLLTQNNVSRSEHPPVDIVAIHGLNGHYLRTWTHESGCCWIRDLLPSDLDNVRVFSYGYPSQLFYNKYVSGVRHFATDLLFRLRDVRREDAKPRHIIYICHSMGGLVLKQAMILASSKQEFVDIKNNSIGAIFLGTPHRGSDFAALARSLGNMINLSRAPFTGKPINTTLLRSLQHDSHELLAIADDFKDRAARLTIRTFFEQKVVPGLQKLVVEEASATIGLQHEIARPFWRDHRDLCRFDSRNDGDYHAILYSLHDIVESHLPTASDIASISTANKSYDDAEQKCLEYLNKPGLAEYLSSLDRRHEGTFRWFDSCEHYYSWNAAIGSAVLWISGYPGYGKTMLSSYLCEILCADTEPKPLLLRFFCSRQHENLSTLLSLVQSLVFQAVERRRQLLRLVRRCSQRGGLQNLGRVDLLWDIFEDFFCQGKPKKVFIVIDGFDEIDFDAQNVLADKFAKLIAPRSRVQLKLILTSRPECTTIARLMSLNAHFVHCQLQIYNDRIGEDVATLVRARLSTLVERGTCSPKVRDVLAAQLIRQAESTFLWVTLALKALERRGALLSRDAVLLSKQLPSGLSELYRDLLSSIDIADVDLAVRLIHLVSVSPRPLRGQELCFLATIKSEHHRSVALEDGCEINLRTIQALIGPLVRISDGKVHLIHQSLKEYLRSLVGSTVKELTPFALDITQAIVNLSIACMQYLAFEDFSEDIITAMGKFLVRSDASKLPLEPAFEDVFEFSMFDSESEDESLARQELSKAYPLYDFASAYGVRLFATIEDCAPKEANTLIPRLYVENSWRAKNWIGHFAHLWGQPPPRFTSPIVNCAYFGTSCYLQELLESPTKVPDTSKHEALDWAARFGHVKCLEMILSAYEQSEQRRESVGLAIRTAAANGQTRCVDIMILDDSGNANYCDRNGRTAISLAAENNHPQTVAILLTFSTSLAGTPDNKGLTPLMYGVFAASEDVIKLLRSSGHHNPTAVCLKGRSALSWAAEDGNVAVIKELLLDSNTHSRDRDGLTPLMHAARNGCLRAVATLLTKDKTLTQSLDNVGRNALSHAASQSNSSIVETLLQHDPDSALSVDHEGWTPLSWALDPPGNLDNATMLATIAHSNVNLRDAVSGKSPLSWACCYGYIDIVKMLATLPSIDIMVRDADGRTALSHAAGGGFLDIVEFLIGSTRIDMNDRDLLGRSALDWAELQGYGDVVQCLAVHCGSVAKNPLAIN